LEEILGPRKAESGAVVFSITLVSLRTKVFCPRARGVHQ